MHSLIRWPSFLVLALFLISSNAFQAASPTDSSLLLTFKGNPYHDDLPGRGKKIVLISGDEEYRSEEALPMLAKILSERHGFDCVVLFAINPETKSVDPNYLKNIAGLENLNDADAMILFIRMRELPDEQLAMFEAFFKAGKPFLAIRTATHPFAISKDSTSKYKKWTWNNKDEVWTGGFGQQIIGETWYTHHGVHNGQATRGVIPAEVAGSPILKGVKDVFGPTDVYGVVHLPKTANVLMLGQVVDGMKETDPPLAGAKNDPMMPMVWTKDYQLDDGKPGKVMCSTIGSAVDFQCEDLRRLVVNATYWMAGLESKIPQRADVTLPAGYKPTYFGFKKEKDFFSKQGIKPSDLVPK
jgi:hypothetical protein